LVKVEAIIDPTSLDAVKVALAGLKIGGVTIVHVLDHSGPTGLKVAYRGGEYYVDMSKVKLEMVVASLLVDDIIDAISRSARAGIPGGDDGMILVYEIGDAIRIRNGLRTGFALF